MCEEHDERNVVMTKSQESQDIRHYMNTTKCDSDSDSLREASLLHRFRGIPIYSCA